jgi:hypothetical protein
MTTAIALSAAELAELASCETVIEHGLKVFQAVGVALITIREKRLYRAEFTTFEAYCAARWGFSDRQALRLMSAAEVVNNLIETRPIGRVLPDETPPIGGVLPANEAQVRPLTTLSPDQQRAAWQQAVETAPNGKVTGAHVEQVAQQFKPTNSHRSGVRFDGEGAEPDLDENGLPLTGRRDADVDEDDGIIGVGDTIQYLGQTYTVRASGSKVWLDVPSRHPLRSEGLDPEDVILIERAPARSAAPRMPAVDASTPPSTDSSSIKPLTPKIVEAMTKLHGAGWMFERKWGYVYLEHDLMATGMIERKSDARMEFYVHLTPKGCRIIEREEIPVAPFNPTERLIPVVDGMRIDESHPVGFNGLYATDEAIGYGKATCSTCGTTSNAWTPIPAGQWRCRCGETTNDDQMQIVGKDEYDLEQRMAKSRQKPKTNYAAPASGVDQRDLCQTPPYAIDPLLPYVSSALHVWEPAYGEGLLTEALYDSGFKTVITGDIQTGENFFEYTPDAWDVIVTNPPFSLKYRWLERCYALEKPFALLMPLEVLGAKSAQVLFRQHGINVIFLSDRVDFKMPNLGWDGSGAQFPVAWFCWGLPIAEQMVFADIEEAKRAFKAGGAS